MIEQLIDKMNSLWPMGEELTEKIKSIAIIRNYAAGDFILKEGQVCNKAAW